ncbi:hypothetical protein CsSME_00025395 [Camellia sinensis var. sinensis]
MEDDDDEFGDLYTDVLRPLQSSALSQNRPIDLNIQSDDEDILLRAPNSNPNFNFTSSHQNQTLVFNYDKAAPELGLASSSDSHRNLNLNLDLDGKQQSQEVEKEDGLAEGVSNWGLGLPEPSVPRVLETGGDLKFPNLIDESGIDVVVEERADKDDLLVAKDECSLDKNDNFEKFDIEAVNTGIEDLGSEPVIPGLSIPGVSDAVDNRGDSNFVMRDVASGEGDDWDSDSEDDLQIVLNDNHGPMAMGKTGVIGSDDEDEDEHLQLRKQFDNGNLRAHHDKDVRSRHREKEDNMRSRYENVDDLHRKRRKEEEHLRRDAEKEEILRGYRENSSHRKRERDDALDLRKRDEQMRTRDEDQHSARHKEESWIHRERGERQRERDERHMIKQSYEESLLKREREEERGAVRSARAAEDKARVSHARLKDEYKGADRGYQFKDIGRHGEQPKRRDRVEDGSLLQHRGWEDVRSHGNQLSINEKRQERASTRDRAISGSDNNRLHEKKHKENMRKSKESEGGEQNSMGHSKRNQDDQSGRMNEPVKLKGTTEWGNGEHEILLNRHSSRKHREDASSDDERQDSRRGRSKLERWTSHKERDFNVNSKSSSSLKVKVMDKFNNGGPSSLASKLPNESSKTVETVENQHPLGDQKDVGDPEIKNDDAKSLDDRHLDTVERLKKRSERFKLPMPSEKEAMVIKKMENEPLPSTQSEACADSEIKPERPARKRRWISN